VIERSAFCFWAGALIGACTSSQAPPSAFPREPIVTRASSPDSSPEVVQPSSAESGAPLGPPSSSSAEPDRDAPAASPREPRKTHAFQEPLPAPQLSAKMPIMRYANLSPGACRAELKKRGVSIELVAGARGIATPVRLKGPVRGIRFVTPGRRSIYGKLDCRLAIALDELARILERHQVSEVQIDNLYRPRAHLPGSRKRSQHSYGLAVDLLSLTLRDGQRLEVERDWQGAIGAPPCGPESRLLTESDAAILLRNLVCDVAREGIFHHVLTPNFDQAHRDHLHVDIKRGDRAIIVR
jgi:hypothetical protein